MGDLVVDEVPLVADGEAAGTTDLEALERMLAAIRFYRSGRFDRRAAVAFAIGGIPGVLVAVYIVKELPLDVVRWVVVGVLLYTSLTLWLSSRQTAPAS